MVEIRSNNVEGRYCAHIWNNENGNTRMDLEISQNWFNMLKLPLKTGRLFFTYVPCMQTLSILFRNWEIQFTTHNNRFFSEWSVNVSWLVPHIIDPRLVRSIKSVEFHISLRTCAICKKCLALHMVCYLKLVFKIKKKSSWEKNIRNQHPMLLTNSWNQTQNDSTRLT